jgi:hypothetical protein
VRIEAHGVQLSGCNFVEQRTRVKDGLSTPDQTHQRRTSGVPGYDPTVDDVSRLFDDETAAV